MNPLTRAIKANLLAVVSLVIALTSLSYNTWRNEATELNRNHRAAGFALLQELAKLQLLSDRITYDQQTPRSQHIAGWAQVIFINDLAALTTPGVQARAMALKTVWESEFSHLKESDLANQRVSQGIEQLRRETMDTLNQLK